MAGQSGHALVQYPPLAGFFSALRVPSIQPPAHSDCPLTYIKGSMDSMPILPVW
jgi:hypothetical protein